MRVLEANRQCLYNYFYCPSLITQKANGNIRGDGSYIRPRNIDAQQLEILGVSAKFLLKHKAN